MLLGQLPHGDLIGPEMDEIFPNDPAFNGTKTGVFPLSALVEQQKFKGWVRQGTGVFNRFRKPADSALLKVECDGSVPDVLALFEFTVKVHIYKSGGVLNT